MLHFHLNLIEELVENAIRTRSEEGFGPQLSPYRHHIASKIRKTPLIIVIHRLVEFQQNQLSGFHFLEILEFKFQKNLVKTAL